MPALLTTLSDQTTLIDGSSTAKYILPHKLANAISRYWHKKTNKRSFQSLQESNSANIPTNMTYLLMTVIIFPHRHVISFTCFGAMSFHPEVQGGGYTDLDEVYIQTS